MRCLRVRPNLAAVPLLALLLVTSPAAWARPVQSEGQIWYLAFAQGPVDRTPFLYYVEAQPRFGPDDALLILRSALGLALPRGWSAWAGYAWLPVLGRDGISSVRIGENRFFQQLLYYGEAGQVRLMSRTRLEQRLITDAGGTSHRARTFFRGAYPLGENRSTYALVWDEVFFHLNSVDQGPRAGFDQNRLFAGLGWHLSDRVRFEVGYLNVVVHKPVEDHYRIIHAPYIFTIFDYL